MIWNKLLHRVIENIGKRNVFKSGTPCCVRYGRFVFRKIEGRAVSNTMFLRPYSCSRISRQGFYSLCSCKYVSPHNNEYSVSRCSVPMLRTYCDSKVEEKKPSLLQRFKQMYRDYWYVLVPVHLVTSAVWFGSFYYIAESGIDIASTLEYIGAGEKLVTKLRSGNSTMGYIAIAYALYKIATPLRYTVTLGGTTISIKYLKDWGYIKPIPPNEKLKEMYKEKKDNIKEKLKTGRIVSRFRSKHDKDDKK